ncbi:hypothetical protein [Halolamina salifodinae]|uniref:Restriction endonuclease n=1 Tax=Halolamina salifodinae TaxID=1202767 RepID=A0A8T4GXY5_9EURY|nr:hypothetical protein [Halolamina salifodinae]MBP1986973.1 hypothetical protein [Halolamina salifodinae]
MAQSAKTPAKAKQLLESDIEQATPEGYEGSEDYGRTGEERKFDGWIGDIGEAFFHRLVKHQTDFEVEHLGGKTEPDFLLDGVSVDVKTRTVIGDNKRDLLVPNDIEDYPHDLYILLRCVYVGDWEDLPRYERDLYGLELIGIWQGETVVEVCEPFNPEWVQGRPSQNYRGTVKCEYDTKDGDDWMDLGDLVRLVRDKKSDD